MFLGPLRGAAKGLDVIFGVDEALTVELCCEPWRNGLNPLENVAGPAVVGAPNGLEPGGEGFPNIPTRGAALEKILEVDGLLEILLMDGAPNTLDVLWVDEALAVGLCCEPWRKGLNPLEGAAGAAMVGCWEGAVGCNPEGAPNGFVFG